MNCPLCTDQVLTPTFRGGIEIDICPHCRGIWLDRGEIDKLAATPEPPPPPPPQPLATEPQRNKPSKKKKKSKKKGLADRLGDVLEEVLDL